MRSLGQFQTFLFFLQKDFTTTKSTKTHISEQKQKRQRFHALKKHLRGKKSLIRLFTFFAFAWLRLFAFCAFAWLRLFAFLLFMLFVLFVLFVRVKSFLKKNKKI